MIVSDSSNQVWAKKKHQRLRLVFCHADPDPSSVYSNYISLVVEFLQVSNLKGFQSMAKTFSGKQTMHQNVHWMFTLTKWNKFKDVVKFHQGIDIAAAEINFYMIEIYSFDRKKSVISQS